MKHARVTYADGSVINTSINGSHKEILEYFTIGKKFNIGIGDNTDNMQAVVKCEIVLQVKYHSVDENGLVFYQTEVGTIATIVGGQSRIVLDADWAQPDYSFPSYIVIEIEESGNDKLGTNYGKCIKYK